MKSLIEIEYFTATIAYSYNRTMFEVPTST